MKINDIYIDLPIARRFACWQSIYEAEYPHQQEENEERTGIFHFRTGCLQTERAYDLKNSQSII